MFIQKILSLCKKNKNSICLIDKNNTEYSWSTYTMTAIEIASSLYKLGIQRNDIICLNCYNSPQWFFISLACIYSGIIFIPTFIEDQPELLDKILKENNCKAIFFNNEQLISKLKKKKKLIKICLNYKGFNKEFLYWNIFLKKSSDEFIEPILYDENQNYLIYKLYDSDSSIINIYSQQIIQNIKILESNYHFDKSKLISYIPLNNFMIILIDFFYQIYHRGIIYFIDQRCLTNFNSFFSSIYEIKPTIFISIPYIWNKILTKINNFLEYFNKYLFLNYLISIIKFINNKYYLLNENKKLIIYWFLSFLRIVTNYLTDYLKKQIGLKSCGLLLNILGPLNKHILEELSSFNLPILNIISSAKLSGIISLNNIFDSTNMGYPNHDTIISENDDLLIKNQYCQNKYLDSNNYFNSHIKAKKLISGKIKIFNNLTHSIFIDLYKYLDNHFINFEEIIDINENQIIFVVFDIDTKSKLDLLIKKYIDNYINNDFSYLILLSNKLNSYRNNLLMLNRTELVNFYTNKFN